MKLSDRVRPNSEAAPWVIEEIKRLEAELEAKAAPVFHAATSTTAENATLHAAYQRQIGVVMPERKTALNGDVLSFQSEGWNACIDEFARLNGAGSHE